jgi:pimeloyl-ACP methyl ester carboxylesterase
MKRKVVRIGLVLIAVMLLAGAGFVIWAVNAAGPGEQALAALQSGEDVIVEAWQGGYTLRPAGEMASTGLIFYPGGRVDFRSYAPALRQVAAAGYKVVLVRAPLNLAVFQPGAAAGAKEAHPQVQYWAVGGHSLGGSMAAWYAHNQPDQVEGLVLWASYPAGSNDFSEIDLPVISIYGTNDGVAEPDTVTGAASLLPADTRWVAIEGGNHARFGDYGEQSGDGAALIPAEEQWRQTAAATIAFLEGIER